MKTKKRFIQIRFYWYTMLTNLFNSKHFSKYKLKYGAMLLTLAVTGGCREKISNNSSENSLLEKQDSTITTTFDSIKEQTVISSDTLPEQTKAKTKRKRKSIKPVDIDLIDIVELIKPPIKEDYPDVYCYVGYTSSLAQYPGGEGELFNYLSKNIRYPHADKDIETEGVVIAQFVIDKAGKVSNIKIIKSLSKNCDKEVIRVLNLMPKWIPARESGRNVATTYALPVRFKLEKME